MTTGRLRWRELVWSRAPDAEICRRDDPVYGRRYAIVSAAKGKLAEGSSAIDSWKAAWLILQKPSAERAASRDDHPRRVRSRGSTRAPLIRTRFGYA